MNFKSGKSLRRALLSGTAIALSSFAVSAQDASTDSNQDIEEVVVTGSRIVRNGASAPSPVTILNAEAIGLQGEVNIASTLNQLPALGSTFSSAASSGFIGTVGLSFLDLRRLGTDRTLVLVNGRRHVGSQAGSAGVDINSIPQELIESVEVLTGGASAVYGADAVTGVVNFKTKQDYEGASIYAQAGDADEGNSFSYTMRGIFGSNFADDRGNAVFTIEYSDSEGFNARDRSFERRDFRRVNNPDNAGDPNENTANGIPDRIFIEGARLNFITAGGIFSTGPDDYKYTANGFEPFNAGQAFGSSSIGGDGIPLYEIGGSSQADLQRYIATAQINYQLNNDINLFLESKYINSQAEALNGTGPFDIFSIGIGADYGFLTDADRQFMADNNIDAFPFISRSHQEAERSSISERSLFRAVGGLEGEFGESMNFEVSYVFGRANVSVRDNNRLNDRFAAGLDAVIDPDTGNIVCRSDIDADAADALPDFAVNGCVPINILGENAISQEAVDWFTAQAFITETLEQNVVSAFLGGDSTEFGFELPAGPIGWVVGGEYRKESAESNPAVVDTIGLTFGNEIPPTVGGFDVWEAFGEISIPLLADTFLAKDLTVDGAVRLSDYSTIGSTTTWKVGLNWAPVEQLRFRGTYSEAVRAPNISELFGPQSQTFLFYDDPCDVDFIDEGSEHRVANCAALGIPVGFEQAEDAGNTPGTSGGNPNVSQESSKSLTLGAVWTPEFAPGLSFTVDYWDIEIKDAISTASLDDVLSNCVDAPTLNNQFCAAVTRDPNTHDLVTFEITNQNFSKLEASGIDFEANYLLNLADLTSKDLGTVDFRLIGTYLIKNDSFPFQTDPDFVDDEKGELGDPEWAMNFNATWNIAKWTFNYEMRYFSSQLLVENDSLESNPDSQYPLYSGNAFYHDVQVRYQIRDNVQVFGGVNNISQKFPPLNLSAAGSDSAIYDNIGRFYYGGVRVNF